MAILLFKVFTVIVKTTAKPIIQWVTYYKRLKLQEPNSKFKVIKEKIIWVGQFINFYNVKINRRLFSLSKTEPIKSLSEDKAIEKGSEFISELLVYSIVLSLPIMEWIRQNKINKQNEFIKEEGIRKIKYDIYHLHLQNVLLKIKLDKLKNNLEELNYKL